MFNLLKFVRYSAFPLFVICNAIITSAAVWNMSILQDLSLPRFGAAKGIDGYLIFVGSSGLLLIFPIIFFEIWGKNVVLGRVWFELLWVGLFFVMELAGAAAMSAQSKNLCADARGSVVIQVIGLIRQSPCSSAQVLQAFTWIVAIVLLGYFTLLSVLTFKMHKEDPTIWHCRTRRFPWKKGASTLGSNPPSPTEAGFRNKTPVIAAPKPQRAGPILSWRSGVTPNFDVEQFQAPLPGTLAPMIIGKPFPPIPAETISQPPQLRQITEQAQQTQPPVFASPFYHSSVQTAIEKAYGTQPQPQAPPAAQLSQVRRLAASPPPLGDWPRLDATSRPRDKRKLPPLQTPNYSNPQTHLRSAPVGSQLQPSSISPSSAYALDGPASASSTRSRQSRPSGPRRKSSEDNRPPPLDLSRISAYRSPGFQ